MKLFLVCATLVVWGQPVSAQPEVTWERVGNLPHDSRFPVSIDPHGDLWRAINEVKVINGEQVFYQGLYRLPAPYDATTPWGKISEPAGGSSNWIYVISRDTLLVHDTAGTYRSTDSGSTWNRVQQLASTEHILEIPPGLPYAGRLIAAQPTKMAAISDDRGVTWTTAEPVQTTTAERITVVTTGAHAGRLVAAGISGITVSDDGGITWETTSEWAALQQDAKCIATLEGQAPGSGDRLVTVMNDTRIADDSLRVITSDDAGETWNRGQALFPGAFRTCKEVVDLGEGRAAAVMMRGPVWWTEDAGATWVQWAAWEDLLNPEDATTTDPRAFWALVGPDGRLYIGLFTGGGNEAVYDKRTSAVVAPTMVAKESKADASAIYLRVSPNPARQRITLELAGSDRQPVEVVVADAQGREVARNELAGSSWRLDVSAWAPGVYLARIVGDRQHEAVRFTVVR